MRVGSNCRVHQTLTSEAASVVKQSLGLAHRRGHAHVTPLHVAVTLLCGGPTLLQRACYHAQNQPQSTRALELCFNVALNRLPMSPHAHSPSFSNALVAALKRAQAQQRRGRVEDPAQQGPLVSIKVHLEELVISILDDPGVSRVMREAGFSSTSVKLSLEEAGLSANHTSLWPSHFSNQPPHSHGFSMESGRILRENNLKGLVPIERVYEQLTCCAECTFNYEKETAFFNSTHSTLLPSFLQGIHKIPHKNDSNESKRKWNRICHSLHNGRFSDSHSNGSTLFNNRSLLSCVNMDHSYTFPNSPSFLSMPRFRQQQQPSLDSLKNKDVKITLSLGNSTFSDSEKLKKSENDVCKLMQENVPWQASLIPSIVKSLMGDSKLFNNETWILLHGDDWMGKRKLAHVISDWVFGSDGFVFHMDSPKQEMLSKALENHKKLLVLVENVELADTRFMKFLGERFENGKLSADSCKKEGSANQVIYILTQGDDKRKNVCSVIPMKMEVSETSPTSGKRKAELDLLNKMKTPRMETWLENIGNRNSLDLNVCADEENGESENFSPVSSDLTREATNENFVDLIDNRFVLVKNSGWDSHVKGIFLSMLEGYFGKVYGGEGIDWFGVDEKVLEGIVLGSGYFGKGLFGKWMNEVFHTSLESVKDRVKEENIGVCVRLCLGGKDEEILDFMGSNLPNTIQLSFIH